MKILRSPTKLSLKNLTNTDGDSFGKVVIRKNDITWSSGVEFVYLEIKGAWELKIFESKTLV